MRTDSSPEVLYTDVKRFRSSSIHPGNMNSNMNNNNNGNESNNINDIYAPDLLYGFLRKTGNSNNRYRERWFQQEQSMIYYYSNKTSKEPLGFIDLNKMISVERDSKNTEIFRILTNDRVWHLKSSEDNVIEHWITTLRLWKSFIETTNKLKSKKNQTMIVNNKSVDDPLISINSCFLEFLKIQLRTLKSKVQHRNYISERDQLLNKIGELSKKNKLQKEKLRKLELDLEDSELETYDEGSKYLNNFQENINQVELVLSKMKMSMQDLQVTQSKLQKRQVVPESELELNKTLRTMLYALDNTLKLNIPITKQREELEQRAQLLVEESEYLDKEENRIIDLLQTKKTQRNLVEELNNISESLSSSLKMINCDDNHQWNEEKSEFLQKQMKELKTLSYNISSKFPTEQNIFNILVKNEELPKESMSVLRNFNLDVEDIKYEGNSVKSITFDKLFELMVMGDFPHQIDPIEHVFLINYKYLIAPLDLLEKLILTYCTTPSLYGDSSQFGNIEERMRPVRLRVINIIKKWVRFHPSDFENKTLKKLLLTFVNLTIKTSFPSIAKSLALTLMNSKKDILTSEEIPLPSLLPNDLNSFTFLELNSTEIARQVTLICFEKYQQIEIHEIKSYVKKNKDMHAPNIISFIEMLNGLTHIVMTSLVVQIQTELRVSYFKKWITVLQELFEMKNFCAFEAILGAFWVQPVHRLRETFAALGKDTLKILDQFQGVNAQNFKQLRLLCSQSNTHCIPYFGIYLKDLTYLNELPLYLEKNLINLKKMNMEAQAMESIINFQKFNYPFLPQPKIQEFILKSKQLDLDAAMKLSSLIEKDRKSKVNN
eukprot:TRINITY_DN7190_c0_g1_i1.p1 TRINITY_DN7190_c0_g1~~TRINITY_DN7190_c0_g1_i1.p1  ORF type:complete len:831 (+),score=220.34 TRINITY_DN7190_c0_g1_i1:38-2530(+)